MVALQQDPKKAMETYGDVPEMRPYIPLAAAPCSPVQPSATPCPPAHPCATP